ncbi:hypothetical protein BHE74_00008945 [Ensete ventricosum]|nr:hypothetical protein BHE74_00008945 [Ensete ventricosum]
MANIPQSSGAQFATSYGQAPNSMNAPPQYQVASQMQTPAPSVTQPWSIPGTQSIPHVTPVIQTAQQPSASSVTAPVRNFSAI